MLRAAGEVTVGAQEFAVDRLKLELDRKAIEGRIAYAAASGAKPPRLDAELKAAELDVDGILAFGRAALDGSAFERPRMISLAVDIGRATIAGIDVKGVSGTFKLDPDGLTFDKVRIADLADAAFNLNGRMEGALDAPRGTVTFDVDARGLDGTVAVLDEISAAGRRPAAPGRAEDHAAQGAGDARNRAGLVDRSAWPAQDQARARRQRRRAAHQARRRGVGRHRDADAARLPARRADRRRPTAARSPACSGSIAPSRSTSAPA